MKQQSKAEVETLSGLKFPADAVFLHQGESGRQGEAYKQYLLESHTGFEIKKEAELTIPSESIGATIATLLPEEKSLKVTQPQAYVSDWNNDQGSWRACRVATTQGWLLELEYLGKKPM